MAKGSNVAQLNDHRGSGKPEDSILAQPDEKFLSRIKSAVDDLEEIDEKRTELTASKTAIFAQLAADYAVNKDAMRAAMRYVKLKDDAKQNYDLTYQVCRRALGSPVQMDLFDQQLERAVKIDQAKRKIEAVPATGEDPKSKAEALFVPPGAEEGDKPAKRLPRGSTPPKAGG
jgi:hypothetical protein